MRRVRILDQYDAILLEFLTNKGTLIEQRVLNCFLLRAINRLLGPCKIYAGSVCLQEKFRKHALWFGGQMPERFKAQVAVLIFLKFNKLALLG